MPLHLPLMVPVAVTYLLRLVRTSFGEVGCVLVKIASGPMWSLRLSGEVGSSSVLGRGLGSSENILGSLALSVSSLS